MTRTIIDFHLLQDVPPSNLNRDDTGSPKTAIYGGVRRARVSSQAWKHATRDMFIDYLDQSELGIRTKRVVELVADRAGALDPDLSPETLYNLQRLYSKLQESQLKSQNLLQKEGVR